VRSLASSLHAFAALDLTVRKRLAGLLHGDHAGVQLGPGSDPEEVVRYRPGEDDVRRIDWNVTARSTEPHVWHTRAEHELEAWVLLDQTASMDFGTVEVEKGDIALWVTGALGLISDRPGNRMGVAHLRADGVHWSPPLGARRAAVRLLSEPRPERAAERRPSATAAGTTLGQAIALLAARHRRPGLRVVVSDFVEPDGRVERPFEWEPSLRRLAVRHDVIVVEIVDPRELALPDVGPVVLQDPETGHRCEVWTSRPRLRQQYAALAAAHRSAVAQAVRASGAQHLVLRTDRDWVVELARLLSARRHPRRARRDPGGAR
jgi:uncharacterized protein (DUF58 family)